MKRFRLGKTEVSLPYSELKKIRAIFEVEEDQEAISKLWIVFREEKLEFSQETLDKVLQRIELK